MDKNELDKLEALAKAATPGEWIAYEVYACNGQLSGMDVSTAEGVPLIADEDRPGNADAEFIAAFNPAVVLQLIALARAGSAAPTGKDTPESMANSNARFAIDGAIQYGRENRNPPPSADHWLAEYWNIGRQLAKLGETGWDNVTPLAARCSTCDGTGMVHRADGEYLGECDCAAPTGQQAECVGGVGGMPCLGCDNCPEFAAPTAAVQPSEQIPLAYKYTLSANPYGEQRVFMPENKPHRYFDSHEEASKWSSHPGTLLALFGEPNKQDVQDAARWRMLPAFFEEYQINALKLLRDIDAAMSAAQAQPKDTTDTGKQA